MKLRVNVLTMALALLLCLCSRGLAQDNKTAKDLKTADTGGRISYAIGFDLTNRLKDSFTINPELFVQGMKDSLAGNPAMTAEEVQKALTEFQNMARKKQMAARLEKADANKAAGKAFLAENKTKEGVKALPSGLQYKVITAGDGEKPTLDSKVKCHYEGTLLDGTVFDSSYKRNQPAVFPVKGVIKGWTEALQLMTVGSKWQLFIPSDLGYGDNGAGQAIEPGATLIFEVELLGIETT